MIDRIAHQMRERVLDGLNQRPVQLRLAPVHFQLDQFFAGTGQIADHAGQPRPEITDRLHARLHDAFLQLAGDVVQLLRGLHKDTILHRFGKRTNLVPGQHQFAHQVHQLIEQSDVHADAAFRRRRR